MKSAQGKNSETPVSASLRSFSSAAGVTEPSPEFLEPLGVLRSFHLPWSDSSITAVVTTGWSTGIGASVRGGVGVGVTIVRFTVTVDVKRALVSMPTGTGRFTLLTVGTHWSTSLKKEGGLIGSGCCQQITNYPCWQPFFRKPTRTREDALIGILHS